MATKVKYDGWQRLATLQSKEILAELNDSKEQHRAKMIIAETGLGKSYAVEMFMEKHGANTYLITVGDSYSLVNIIDELMLMVGSKTIRGKNSRFYQVKHLKQRLLEMSKSDEDVMIILDEAENMRHKAFKTIKELYDAVHRHCSIVLMGTDQILELMHKKNGYGQSIPQTWRRFKAGTRIISELNKARDFKPFFQLYDIDKNVQDLLLEICENYGELHDYLDPLLRYCARKNEPLTEELFRVYHKVPKHVGRKG